VEREDPPKDPEKEANEATLETQSAELNEEDFEKAAGGVENGTFNPYGTR